MTAVFASSRMNWIGSNLLWATDRQHMAYRNDLDHVILPKAVADGAAIAAHRLEKMRQSPRISVGSDYLSIFEFDRLNESSAFSESEVSGIWADTYELIWRMSWIKISDTGTVGSRPDRVRLLALSPPDDASEGEIEEWNRFYTDVHVPEAMQRRGWTRATRWRLDRVDQHPKPGCPHYCVLYEGIGFRDATDQEVAAWGPWTEGPPVWKRSVPSWTLDYRVVAHTTGNLSVPHER